MKKRVLLVEDEVTGALLMQESLRDLQDEVEVHVVSSGEEALKQLETQEWDLIVTDHRMAGMTGLELIETVHATMPATLTILITGYGSEELEQAAQRLQVHRYLTKPFSLVNLKRIIRDALALEDHRRTGGRPDAEKEAQQAVKVTLGGDGSVGKSALIRRLCTGEFQPNRVMTIGVDFFLHDIKADSSSTRLIVWDVSGQDRFAFTRRAFYRGSKAVGLVYDVSSRQSFERLQAWWDEIHEMLPKVAVVLAANKTDLPRVVSIDEGRSLAARWGIAFFETSCVNGDGVKEFFSTLGEKALESLSPHNWKLKSLSH